MTVSTLRPNGTVSTSGTPSTTGAASAHAATSDDSDASYVTYNASESVVLSLGDLTLPAGAVIKSLAVRLRVAKVVAHHANTSAQLNCTSVTGGVVGGNTSISWSTPTTITLFTYEAAGVTDASVNAATLTLGNRNDLPFHDLRAYEAYVDVTYVAIPVVSADAPTGTITTTNRPTVEWSNTLDSDGGGQTRYDVRVFTDAQYGAGGFDPATSTANPQRHHRRQDSPGRPRSRGHLPRRRGLVTRRLKQADPLEEGSPARGAARVTERRAVHDR